MSTHDTAISLPHNHAGGIATFGCPGCVRAVKVAEFRRKCEQMDTEDLIDHTSLDGPPVSWHNIIADGVLSIRFTQETMF